MDDSVLIREMVRRGLVESEDEAWRVLELEERLIQRDRLGQFATTGGVGTLAKGRGGGKLRTLTKAAPSSPAKATGSEKPHADTAPIKAPESPEAQEKQRKLLGKIAKAIPVQVLKDLHAGLAKFNAHHTAHGLNADEVAENLHRFELVGHHLMELLPQIQDAIVPASHVALGLVGAEEQEDEDESVRLAG